jgi:hypothetical protein
MLLEEDLDESEEWWSVLKELSLQSVLPLKGAIVYDYSAILFVDYGLSGLTLAYSGFADPYPAHYTQYLAVWSIVNRK